MSHQGKQRLEPRKVETVANWPTSHTKTQVFGFLGMAGYYRRFIAKNSAINKLLTNLLQQVL